MAKLQTIEYTANTEFDAYGRGISTKKAFGSYAKTAELPADADYVVIAHKMVTNSVLNTIKLTSPAIVGFTDADIVMLDSAGAEVKNNAGSPATVLLADGITFANALSSKNVLGLSLTFDRTKSLAEMTGKSAGQLPAYVDIALKVNTAGTNTGTIETEVEFSAPQ